MLINRSDAFKKTAEMAVREVRVVAQQLNSLEQAIDFMEAYVNGSPYSARVFEVAMHSFFQVLDDEKKIFGGYLKTHSLRCVLLIKKHGNVGDIEIVKKQGGLEILEAWDAKYGKRDLRDELEELNEKLADHSEAELVGFVVDGSIELKPDIQTRIAELEEIHEVKIEVYNFRDWIRQQATRLPKDAGNINAHWLTAFCRVFRADEERPGTYR